MFNAKVSFYSLGLSGLGADIATLVYRLEINVSQSRQIKDVRSGGRQRSNNLSDTVIYEDVYDDQQFYALSVQGEDPWLAGYIYNNQGTIGGLNVTAGEYPWSHKVSNVMPSGKACLKMLVQKNYEDNSLTEDGIVIVKRQEIKSRYNLICKCLIFTLILRLKYTKFQR